MLGIVALLLTQSGQPDFVQPLLPAPILAIRADLNGKDSVLGIDTGSFDFILKPPANATDKTAQVTLNFLSPNPVEAKYAQFPSPAEGIIGLNYLHDKAIGIDAPDGAMSFWNKGNLTTDQVTFWFTHSPDAAGKSWAETPTVTYSIVDLEDAGDGHFLVDGKLNGSPAKFGLDTDAAISGIDASVVKEGFLDLEQANFGGIKQNWPVHIGIVDDLSFGTQDLKSLPMIEAPNGSLAPAQGLLGYDLLENRRALIDFPAHKLYLGDPAATPRGREALLALGIRLAPFVGGHQYIGVIPDSVAAKAGLHSGDEIVSVDGQPVGAENAAKTGSSLPFDYAKSGLPKSIKIVAKSSKGQPKTYSLALP